MQTLIMIGQLLLGLSILVILHEFGHFWAARAFGIKVEKFYLFFDAYNFKLFSFKKGDTEYGVGWLPLGGYVKIAGMIDESVDTEQMKKPAESWEFRSKPAWQRLIVMIGGVVVNAVLAVIIFAGLLIFYGEKYTPMSSLENGILPTEFAIQTLGLEKGDFLVAVNNQPLERFEPNIATQLLIGSDVTLTIKRNGKTIDLAIPSTFTAQYLDQGKAVLVMPRYPFTIGGIEPGTGAEAAGLQKGDKIVQLNQTTTYLFDELQAALAENADKLVILKVERNNQVLELEAQVSDKGTLGFYAEPQIETAYLHHNVLTAVPAGITMANNILRDNLAGFKRMFSGEVPVTKSLGGPIAIAQKMYGGVWDWYRFWMTTGLLSIILAFMNILPIPALDGGHVVFLIIEMIKGGPVSEKVLLIAQYIGMAILLTLMVFIFGNDIWQYIIK